MTGHTFTPSAEPFGTNDSLPIPPPDIRAVLEEHQIDNVWDAHCDYSAEVRCACGWDGAPNYYTEHLLFLLGITSTTVADWLRKFVGSGNARGYADLFDDPRIVKQRKTAETKARNAQKKIDRLRRMAANGDADARTQLAAMEARA